MNFFRCVNNSNNTFKLHEFILQCLKNIREFFQVDRMSNCEMVDHQKVWTVTLTQSVLRDWKSRRVLRGLRLSKRLFDFQNSHDEFQYSFFRSNYITTRFENTGGRNITKEIAARHLPSFPFRPRNTRSLLIFTDLFSILRYIHLEAVGWKGSEFEVRGLSSTEPKGLLVYTSRACRSPVTMRAFHL